MPYTLREVAEYLKQMDPDLLLEKLDISSEELVERFIDKIEEEDRYNELEEEMSQEEEE